MGKCNLCNHKKFVTVSKKVRDSKKSKIIQCTKCNNIQLEPIPTIEEDKKFYNKNLQMKNIKIKFQINKLKKKSQEDTKRRIKFISKFLKKDSKILEIGSGYGFFLEGMQKHGYEIEGIEVSKERLEYAKKKKLKIFDINLLDDSSTILKKYDLIVSFHVLEHIVDPKKFLKEIRTMLKSKGKIIFEVPNSNDYQLKLNSKYNEWYWQRAHINYYHPKTLSKLLKNSGFKNIQIQGIQRYSIENMFNWKLNQTPQKLDPVFSLTEPYKWIENFYKSKLEKSLISDTIISLATK